MDSLKTSILCVVITITVTAATYEPINITYTPHMAAPCQTEVQWEGRASEWDHAKERNNRFNVSYDGIGKRKRIVEEKKSFMPGRRFYEYIMHYNTSTLYTINLNLNICTKTLMTQPWQNHTIPPNAILEDEYELGNRGSGFKVQEWSDRLPARRSESWIGIFTIDGCWPVVEVFSKADSDKPVSLTTRFFDLEVGIADMSVFDPPSICQKEDADSSYFSRIWSYFYDDE